MILNSKPDYICPECGSEIEIEQEVCICDLCYALSDHHCICKDCKWTNCGFECERGIRK